MLDITLVTIGKIKDKNYQAAAAEYVKRLKPYAKLKVIELLAAPFSLQSRERSKEIEGKRIEDCLSSRSGRVFLLAERGKVFASGDFAAFLEKSQPLTLVLGGALGFSSELYKKYPSLSLSLLTFPHELARVVFLEQLYRAVTILNKKDYHY